MKLTKKDKIIWDSFANYSMPSPPSKKDVWMRLEQQITISEKVKIFPAVYKKSSLTQWHPRFIYALIIAILLLTPTTLTYLNTIQIKTDKGFSDHSATLIDGSIIKLNSGSSLKYSKNYNKTNREVSLKGEAYFDVVKSSKPFIISTDYGQIEVLGTKFNVKTRHEGFETGVNEGSILVKNDTQSITLEKGECIIINNNLMQKMSAPEEYPGWLNNKILCDKTPLINVCEEIQRVYDIKISFLNESHKNITVSGVIELDKNNLNNVLSSISLLAQREFKLRGGSFIIL